MDKIIEITLEDINEGISKAYENIAKKAGYEINENTVYDCRRIEVSRIIDDYFWKWYKDKAIKENPNLTDQDINMAIAMLMLQKGAKRNEKLENWKVLVQDGFVHENEG